MDLLERRQMLAVSPASDFTYTTTNGQVAITAYVGSASDVEIPATINSLPVTSIEHNAFLYRTSLASVTIPSSVTSIGGSAFAQCSRLKSVNIECNATSIGTNAFLYCTSLTTVAISGSVTTLGDGAFSMCSSLVSMAMPVGATAIGNDAFFYCTSLTSVTIPSSVGSVGNEAFYGCTSLTAVTISPGVTSIGKDAFSYCDSLVALHLPATVNHVGEYAFDSSSLKGVYFYGDAPQVDSGVSLGGDGLTMYHLPSTSGWSDQFSGASTALFPASMAPTAVDGVRGGGQVQLSWTAPASDGGLPVKDYMIQYSSDDGISWQTVNRNASTVTSATVTGLTNGTAYVFRVASVNDCGAGPYSTNSSAVTPQSDFTYTAENGQIAITGYTGSSPAVDIPATIDGLPVTSIADNAFFNLSWITSIVIPSGMQRIGFGSFAGTGITSLNLPASVSAFSNSTYACFQLATITVDPGSESFVSIDGILYDKQVQTLIRCPSAREQAVTIPDTVTAIGYAAFIHCSKLTTIIGLQPAASIGWDAFSYCNNLRYLLEPSATTAPGDYLTYTVQSNYVDGIIITGFGGTGVGVAIPDAILGRAVVGIGSDAFNTRRSLESISIPSSVTGIGNAAFANCNSLKSIAIPSGVTYIGFDAFQFCTSLTSITLPKNLAFLGGNDFYGSTNLVSIDIDPSNEYLASIDGVLYDKALTAVLECPKSKAGTVILPASVTAIGTTFANCTRLSRIVIPEGVTTIVAGAFDNCPAVLETTGASPFAPGKPSSIRGNGQVQLSWTATAADLGLPVKDYTIQYSSDGGNSWQTYGHEPSVETSVTVTGLVNGTVYRFRVASVTDTGTKFFSAQSSAVIPATTPGVSTAVAGIRGNGQVYLSWTAPVSNGGLPVTDYAIQYSADGASWQTFGHVAAVATSATVTGLTNGTGYLFRVAGVNDVGTGQYALTASKVTPSRVPPPPSNLVIARGLGVVTLSWTAPLATGGIRVLDYVIQYSTNGGVSWVTVRDGMSTRPSAVISGLAIGRDHIFRVASVGRFGAGDFSSPSAIVRPATVASAPIRLMAIAGVGQVTVSWNAPASNGGSAITRYLVQYAALGGRWVTATGVGANTTTYTVSGLASTRQYSFRVLAVNEIGTGAASRVAAARTLRLSAAVARV